MEFTVMLAMRAMGSLIPKLEKFKDPDKLRENEVKNDVEFLSTQMKTIQAALRKVSEDQRDDAEFVRMREAKKVTEILLAGMATPELKVLSVVGLGGLGKTTLVKVVYDTLRSQFDSKAFVSLSPNPDMKRVFKEMLHQLDNKEYVDLLAERELICKIRELLQDKRYLIVIDDIWDLESWGRMRCALLDSNCGSRIITTTRITDVATTADKSYELGPLSPDESRMLFNTRFSSGTGTHPCPILDEATKKLLQKCGGIPLAIITIATLLASKPKEDWSTVYDSISFAYGDNKDVKDTARIFSFNHFSLPITLKTCLLYLATSHKKKRIERGSFVRKWIAEGFVSEDGSYSREEVANRYFRELVNMSMIQPVGHDDSLGEVTYEVKYGMFDDLRLVSEREHFVTFLPAGNRISNTSLTAPVRLSIQFSDSEGSIGSGTKEMDLSHVRSVTMFGSAPADLVPFKHLGYLRVLDLDGCKDLDNSAVDDICRMIQLKYLSLKQTQVTELPSQIGKLLHLETLDVRQTRVKELPQEVVKLPKLTHLLFGQTSSLGGVKLPAGSNQLKSVMVLGAVDSRECSASVMEEISELKQVREVALVLHDGPADKERNDKLLSSIGKCANLRLLEIYGDSSPSDKLPASPNLPLLDELKVVGTFLEVPRWIAQLRAIEKLQMKVSKLEPNDLIILGGLPGLTSLALALVGIPRKPVAITSGAGFPCLEKFNFDCRAPWVTFQEGAMPCLKHLQLTLYVYPADKSPSGIMHLQGLNKITLCYSSRYTSAEGVANTVAVIREEASRHGNLIELSINGNYENYFLSIPKAKVDTGTAATEVNTRVSKVITGSEIEEEW
ncbi:disease resistance protein RPM1 [Brachypodium distachyon]|uniref:Uncharacterized protein n=2 Tax=Brachypodium distachyon TaxID=15368 RepID=I1IK42_BRADI|nr:disease resistance protein RPM1 [Brachypodium distachyon]XP_024310940.1 disease resistance protein RPM1 [Brachypodium distachyon]KQJ87647.1 hypothetical protein BRADI_4g12737v3 [Brachypodium distachyon]PNT63183.1 hypothetical protein BRADI_4g12737v3 [Brachypodium distachyon]|eukprot:XP_024310939.1 disease resistance protein RPM1 [Brachypodium distachyon]